MDGFQVAGFSVQGSGGWKGKGTKRQSGPGNKCKTYILQGWQGKVGIGEQAQIVTHSLTCVNTQACAQMNRQLVWLVNKFPYTQLATKTNPGGIFPFLILVNACKINIYSESFWSFVECKVSMISSQNSSNYEKIQINRCFSNIPQQNNLPCCICLSLLPIKTTHSIRLVCVVFKSRLILNHSSG